MLQSFWAAMQDNDWQGAADHLAEDADVDWPCTGERLTGRDAFVAAQATYPSRSGRWTFDIHRLVDDGDVAVSEVTVADGDQSARVIAFSEVRHGLIVRQVEYWPTAYDPPPERAAFTRRIDRVP